MCRFDCMCMERTKQIEAPIKSEQIRTEQYKHLSNAQLEQSYQDKYQSNLNNGYWEHNHLNKHQSNLY